RIGWNHRLFRLNREFRFGGGFRIGWNHRLFRLNREFRFGGGFRIGWNLRSVRLGRCCRGWWKIRCFLLARGRRYILDSEWARVVLLADRTGWDNVESQKAGS
ncbi:MAG: hypothetical protein ACTHUY_00995, partial [Flaviflexus sp.]|uniref:hypothetical protein n=1 Tax=Flaviflexus sp. TaxID=1969482 RepID=UPI003F8F1FAB